MSTDVENAKRRLRQLAQAGDPATWIRRHPWDTVALAFAAGLLAAEEPAARKPMAKALATLLAEGLVSGTRDESEHRDK